MKFFLTSEGVPRPDLLKDLLTRSKNKPIVALSNNAQDPYPEKIAKERGVMVKKIFLSFGFTVIDLDLKLYKGKRKELSKELKKCSLVWFSGGNAFYLRYLMKISGFDIIVRELLSNGLVYGGWSAGSVVAGPSLKIIDLMDSPHKAPEVIYEGLNLIKYCIWPHWDTKKYIHLQPEALKRIQSSSCESIMMKDGEVLIIENGQKRILK